MPDRLTQIQDLVQGSGISQLGLGDDFIPPAYEGYSILNIPDSICGWFEIPAISARPLADVYTGALQVHNVQHIILVVVDALAFERMRRWSQDGTTPIWSELAQNGIFVPLTSITPSTTSAAITTLWTGRSPAEHGLTGYEMWLKEYGVVANTILHSASTFQNDVGGLYRAGFKPEEYLPFPSLGTHLAAHGVETYAFQHASIIHSGLSRTYFKDLVVRRYYSVVDLWINLRTAIESNSGKRAYFYVYWGEIDTLSHSYGPDDERTAAEFAQFSATYERLFYRQLTPDLRRNTLFLLTADHGAVFTPPNPYYDLRRHPELTRRLHIQPTGENRLAYLYVKPGQSQAVRQYVEETWPGQFNLIPSALAAESGLFGPGKFHPGLMDRIGDWIVAGRGNAYLWWANKENMMLGRHGGLTAQEMVVPFLAIRL